MLLFFQIVCKKSLLQKSKEELEKMKPYTLSRITRSLLLLTTVFAPALLLGFFAEVSPEKRASLLFGGVLFGTIFGALAATFAYFFEDEIPNGLARPEEELERGTKYHVTNRFNLSVGGSRDFCVAALRDNQEIDNPTVWRFDQSRDAVALLHAAKTFVYLDDPDDYLKEWQEQGVVMILSKKVTYEALAALAEAARTQKT